MTHPAEAVFDLAHLDRQTLGDAALRAEILALLDAELARLDPELRAASVADRLALAHRLKGAARGTGAFALATAAQALESSPDSELLLGALLERVAQARKALAAGLPARLTQGGE